MSMLLSATCKRWSFSREAPSARLRSVMSRAIVDKNGRGFQDRDKAAFGFLRLPALGDVLKRAVETNRLAIAALGGPLGAHPDVPALRRNQRELEIERGARVDGGLY